MNNDTISKKEEFIVYSLRTIYEHIKTHIFVRGVPIATDGDKDYDLDIDSCSRICAAWVREVQSTTLYQLNDGCS